MGRSCLGNFIMRFRFYGVDQVRKFYRVLYKKYRHVVAYQIEVPLLCIEFYGKPSYITCQIRGASRSCNS